MLDIAYVMLNECSVCTVLNMCSVLNVCSMYCVECFFYVF